MNAYCGPEMGTDLRVTIWADRKIRVSQVRVGAIQSLKGWTSTAGVSALPGDLPGRGGGGVLRPDQG